MSKAARAKARTGDVRTTIQKFGQPMRTLSCEIEPITTLLGRPMRGEIVPPCLFYRTNPFCLSLFHYIFFSGARRRAHDSFPNTSVMAHFHSLQSRTSIVGTTRVYTKPHPPARRGGHHYLNLVSPSHSLW